MKYNEDSTLNVRVLFSPSSETSIVSKSTPRFCGCLHFFSKCMFESSSEVLEYFMIFHSSLNFQNGVWMEVMQYLALWKNSSFVMSDTHNLCQILILHHVNTFPISYDGFFDTSQVKACKFQK